MITKPTDAELKAMHVCMEVASTWMSATGNQFVDVCADPLVQLSQITVVLVQQRHKIAAIEEDKADLHAKLEEQARELAFVHAQYLRLATK